MLSIDGIVRVDTHVGGLAVLPGTAIYIYIFGDLWAIWVPYYLLVLSRVRIRAGFQQHSFSETRQLDKEGNI